jgi:hypothetical protein
MNGEDEEEDVCGISADSASSGDTLNHRSSARTGRDMDLNHFRVSLFYELIY